MSELGQHPSAIALDAVSTPATEGPGLGKALGAVAGGAMGLSGGVRGAAGASLFLPGVASFFVLGAALGDVMGAGAGAGDTLEESLTTGMPQAELFVYEDALRQERENEGGSKEQKA